MRNRSLVTAGFVSCRYYVVKIHGDFVIIFVFASALNAPLCPEFPGTGDVWPGSDSLLQSFLERSHVNGTTTGSNDSENKKIPSSYLLIILSV